LNIAYPATGAQKSFDVDDERKVRVFYEKRIASEIEGDTIGEQFKGYIFKITGGYDKQGFAMKQGVLLPHRVKVLLFKGTTGYHPLRYGERRRKSVRGCIVGPDIAMLNLIIIKKGDEELPGVTDKIVPRRLGPKRASKIRKLFNLSKEDDVRKYVIRRELASKKEGAKIRTKAPKIQRLITPIVLQRKRHLKSLVKRRYLKTKADREAYSKLLAERRKAKKEAILSKKRHSQKVSQKHSQKSSQKKEEHAKH